MPTHPAIKSRFVEALGPLFAANAPGMPISVEAVAAAAGLERSDAIRDGLEPCRLPSIRQ